MHIILTDYYDHGDPTFECKECNALLWEAEARTGNPNPRDKAYTICCQKGKVVLPQAPPTPKPLLDLFFNTDTKSQNFKNNIRTYNSMFSFTSMGGKVDDSINRKGRGPYVFRLHGQTYHKIGSLLPEEGKPPKFCQLYIYDTQNETENREKALRYVVRFTLIMVTHFVTSLFYVLILQFDLLCTTHYAYILTHCLCHPFINQWVFFHYFWSY